MAELSLVPNASVVAVQTAIFLTNLMIAKKLFVEPYLKLQDKRAKLTTGSQSDAAALMQANEKAAAEIEARIQTAAREAAKAREQLRAEAMVKRDTIVKQAESEASATVLAMAQQIAAESAAQKNRIPDIVKTLTNDVYQVAIS